MNQHVIIRGNPRRVNAPGTLTTITFTEDQMAKRSVSKAPNGRHHVVYRHFDADGKLLYIGMSGGLAKRMDVHRQKAPWFRQIAYVSVEHHDSLVGARRAERAAIRTEKPLHNVDGIREGDPVAVARIIKSAPIAYIESLKRPGRNGPRRGRRPRPSVGYNTPDYGAL